MTNRTFETVIDAVAFADIVAAWGVSRHQQPGRIADRRVDQHGVVRELRTHDDGYGVFYTWGRL